MTDSAIVVQGTAQLIDTRQVNTGAGTVQRQVGVIGDPLSGGAVAVVGQAPMASALNVAIASDQTPVPQVQRTEVANGALTFHLVGANTTNQTVIKNSPGKIYGVRVYNNNAAMRKVAFHNVAVAPVAGTTPIKFAILCPPNSDAVFPIGDMGIPFTAGIAITTVTGIADTDATAIGANQLSIEVLYV